MRVFRPTFSVSAEDQWALIADVIEKNIPLSVAEL
jgi:hypothetical protein